MAILSPGLGFCGCCGSPRPSNLMLFRSFLPLPPFTLISAVSPQNTCWLLSGLTSASFFSALSDFHCHHHSQLRSLSSKDRRPNRFSWSPALPSCPRGNRHPACMAPFLLALCAQAVSPPSLPAAHCPEPCQTHKRTGSRAHFPSPPGAVG